MGQYKVGIRVCLPRLLLFWLICCHRSLVLMLYEERHLSYSPSPQVALYVYNYNFRTLSTSTGIQPRRFLLATSPTYAEFLCLPPVSHVMDKILRGRRKMRLPSSGAGCAASKKTAFSFLFSVLEESPPLFCNLVAGLCWYLNFSAGPILFWQFHIPPQVIINQTHGTRQKSVDISMV